jgi:hypothetical protein
MSCMTSLRSGLHSHLDKHRQRRKLRTVHARTRLLIVLCLLTAGACADQRGCTRRAVQDAVDADQFGPPTEIQPQDPLFIDFERNWRQFISTSPELALPVIQPQRPVQEPWDPVFVAECVFSPDAGRPMPQVTLTWNDPMGQGPDVIRAQGLPSQQTPPQLVEPARMRLDLALHFDGFGRNYYSSSLSTAALERFNLPSNSALIQDTPAVMMTGTALFPKLMSFRAEALQDRDTPRQFMRRTLVLRDLREALTYRIRLSSFVTDAWNEDRQYVFLTPVCPNSF